MFLCKIALLFVCATCIVCSRNEEVKSEEDVGVKYANRCEVCKVLATELQSRLEETGKVHDVIEIGYSLDDVQPRKKTKYQRSELRLIESLDGVCEKILEYNIHKERQDSTRFAKGMSQTFKTLHGLVAKGVKVDLGLPYELWDKPSAEITQMKTQCESLLEDYEDIIEDWYWDLQGKKDLKIHLCSDHALRNSDKSCLFDELVLNSEQVPKESDKILTRKSKDADKTGNLNENDDVDTEEQQKRKIEAVDSVEKLRIKNKHIKEGLSDKPNVRKPENKNSRPRGDRGDGYWTEAVENDKKQLDQEEMLNNEPEMSNEKVWIPEELLSEREEL